MFFDVVERIQKKLAVPDKEWEKFKFAVVAFGRPQYINEDDCVTNLADFKPSPSQGECYEKRLGILPVIILIMQIHGILKEISKKYSTS